MVNTGLRADEFLSLKVGDFEDNYIKVKSKGEIEKDPFRIEYEGYPYARRYNFLVSMEQVHYFQNWSIYVSVAHSICYRPVYRILCIYER
jgi:hypothetical protein